MSSSPREILFGCKTTLEPSHREELKVLGGAGWEAARGCKSSRPGPQWLLSFQFGFTHAEERPLNSKKLQGM